MKNSKFVSLVLVSLAIAFAPAVVAAFETPVRIGTTVQTRTVESSAIAVDSDTSVTEHAGFTTLPTITIVGNVVRHAAAKVTGCEFSPRSVLQGPEKGMVRGFCL